MSDTFLCRCSDEESAKCDEMVAEAKRMLVLSEWGSVPDTNEDLYPVLLMELCERGSVTFHADQWFGVDIRQLRYENEKMVVDREFRVECDLPLDGLCAAYVILRTEEDDRVQAEGRAWEQGVMRDERERGHTGGAP